MSDGVPRLRMFAGPNGSGKTTVKSGLGKPPSWFGTYINPDDLEAAIREQGFLPLAPLELTASTPAIQAWFAESAFLKSVGLDAGAASIVCRDGGIDFGGLAITSYHASVLSDFLRRQALAARRSFSFETVMSAPDKVELLREARDFGYRTYLYFIATDDPAINIERVRIRVAEGGHDVPEGKVVERYHRSLKLLLEAIPQTSRAYFFDTSGEVPVFFAEAADGVRLELKAAELPRWFEPVWSRFAADSSASS